MGNSKNAVLLDALVSGALLEDGISLDNIRSRSGGMTYLVAGFQAREKGGHTTMRWSPEEDAFLTNNLGHMEEAEMARILGRTVTAVHLRWKRDLDLTAPSKHPDVITASQAAIMLGVDAHKVTYWCDSGLLPYRLMPGGRKMRLIFRTSFYRWVVSPSHWIYFDWTKIPDDHLRRLCELRAARWGDEWWPSAKVAEFHGVDAKDVQRLVYRGELPAVSVSNLGGRNPDPFWKNWFVRKSDAVKAKFVRGKGAGGHKIVLTLRAIAWVTRARKMKMNWTVITRTMGNKCVPDTLKKAYLISTKKG